VIFYKKGLDMKLKNKTAPVSQKFQGKDNSTENRRTEAWRRILSRLVAVFLIIVFLAGECAMLLPGE
jgi:hypothetical protein